MGCPMPDCRFEVPAHAHAEIPQFIAPGDLTQKFKMPVGSIIHRRNAHQARYVQSMPGPAFRDEAVGVSHAHTGLLLFIPSIDLNEKFKLPLLLCQFLGNGLGNPWPVYGVNHIEKPYRFGGLVGLQGTDKMQLQAWRGCPQGRPFASRFLDPVFTERLLPGLQDWHDFLSAKSLADCDQRDFTGAAANRPGSQFNSLADVLKGLVLG